MARKPGQPQSSGRKHKQAVLDHWRLEVLRGGVDQVALEQIRQRILHDPDIRNDPSMASEIERYIRERSVEIKRIRGSRSSSNAPAHTSHHGRLAAYEPNADEISRIVKHLQAQAREQIGRRDEIAAGFTIERLRTLAEEHPDELDADVVTSMQMALSELRDRRQAIIREIKILADKAVHATTSGDHDAAAAAMRQLSAHHIAHPELLSDESMDAIRNRVLIAGARQQHEEAARDLMRREQEVTRELRELRSAIRDFRASARTQPHDSAAFRVSENAYRKTVRDIRHHDREWLAGTILELVDLLEQWEDHPKSADKQVERFIATLRSTLKQLHAEVREAERLRGTQSQ